MITLITGTPGAGKTAWTIQELTRLPSQRKIYIHGVPDLKIAHEPIYCMSDLCDYCREVTHYVEYDQDGNKYSQLEEIENPGHAAFLVEDWPLWATQGSLIVIDEVQRIWRPSNSSGKLPDEIAALETHRHKGLDFWLISQGPHLFHSNIRLLIGKHIHLVSKWNGRSEYEFPECRQNVTSRGDAVVRPYTLPKKVFHLYKSSSLHVKQTHRKPLAFYGFFGCLFLLVIAFYFGYKRVASHMKETVDVAEQTGQGALAPGTGGAATSTEPVVSGLNADSGFPDFEPSIKGVPESAPAYRELIKVVAVPILAGCVVNKTKNTCACYTKQATVYPTTDQYCRETVKGGRFNPYLNPQPALSTSQSVFQTSSNGTEKI